MFELCQDKYNVSDKELHQLDSGPDKANSTPPSIAAVIASDKRILVLSPPILKMLLVQKIVKLIARIVLNVIALVNSTALIAINHRNPFYLYLSVDVALRWAC